MALIAVDESHPVPVMLGEVRAVSDPDNLSAEFGVVVRSDIKDMGLGTVLLKKMADYCRARGIQELRAETLVSNERVLALACAYGLAMSTLPEEGAVRLRLDLRTAG